MTRRTTVVVVVALVLLVAGLSVAHLPKFNVLRDDTLRVYVALDHFDQEWQSYLRQYDLILFGPMVRMAAAAGVPIAVLEYGLSILCALVTVVGVSLIANALTERSDEALWLTVVLLFSTYATTNLFGQFDGRPGLVWTLARTSNLVGSLAGPVLAIGGALSRRPWVATVGVLFGLTFHPMYAAYAAACVCAISASEVLVRRTSLVPITVMLLAVAGALGYGAFSAYGGDAQSSGETIAAYHQTFSFHHFPLVTARFLPTFLWNNLVAFGVTLVVFPLLAVRLASDQRLRATLAFYGTAAIGVLGLVLTIVVPELTIAIEAGLTRATLITSLLYVSVTGAYFLRTNLDGFRTAVGALGLLWLTCAEPGVGGAGLAAPLAGLLLLLDREHPWPILARLAGGILLVVGAGSQVGAMPADGPAWVRHAAGLLGLPELRIGWQFSALATLVILAAGIGRSSTGMLRTVGTLGGVCVLAGVGAWNVTQAATAYFQQQAVDERLALQQWCRTNLPQDAVVMGGPGAVPRLEGMRMMTGRPAYGNPREWLYRVPMLYANDSEALVRGHARLAQFGLDAATYTTAWPHARGALARVLLNAHFEAAFNATPYEQLKSLLAADGVTHILIRTGSRAIADADIVYRSPTLQLVHLSRTEA